MKKLSFIIPCFNVGQFINDTINSIYDQGLDEAEFDVICINDCSTDNTRALLGQIQLSHENMIVLDQPYNMYSGAARNRGMEVATGDYIWFVDADDMIKPGVAGPLLSIASKDNLDILYFNYDEISEDGEALESSRRIFKSTDVKTGIEFVTDEFKSRLTRLSLLWCRLLKRELVEKYHIRFSDLYITQDAPFAWETLLRADRVMAIESRAYLYRKNATSITARKPNARRSFTWSFGFPNEVRNVSNRLAGVLPEPISEGLDRSIRYEVNQFPIRFLELDESERKKFYEFILAEKAVSCSLVENMNMKAKLVYYCSNTCYSMFSLIVRLLY